SLALGFRRQLLGQPADLVPTGPQLVFQPLDPVRFLLECADLRAELLAFGAGAVQLLTQLRRLRAFLLRFFQLTRGLRPAVAARSKFLSRLTQFLVPLPLAAALPILPLALGFRRRLLGQPADLVPAGPQLVFQPLDLVRFLLERAD